MALSFAERSAGRPCSSTFESTPAGLLFEPERRLRTAAGRGCNRAVAAFMVVMVVCRPPPPRPLRGRPPQLLKRVVEVLPRPILNPGSVPSPVLGLAPKVGV